MTFSLPPAVAELLRTSRDLPDLEISVDETVLFRKNGVSDPVRFEATCGIPRRLGILSPYSSQLSTIVGSRNLRELVFAIVEKVKKVHLERAAEKEKAALRCKHPSSRREREEEAAKFRASAARLETLAETIGATWPGTLGG